MGTDTHVVVVGPTAAAAVDAARDRIEQLEQRWSRFRPDSEISRLSESAGAPCLVSEDTFLLIDRAVEGWRSTAGRFDPTVGASMVANGYDRDLPLLADADDGGRHEAARPAPGCDDLIVDADLRLVLVPPGTQLDPGAIAKGLAADLVSGELLAGGAEAVVVNIGGDLRVRGAGPDHGRWPIRIEDPRHPCRELLTLAVSDAGVASSSVVRRRWRHGGHVQHHVVDPHTGRAADTVLVGVTVIASDAWRAEVVATELLLDPDPAAATRARSDVAAIGIEADGALHLSPSLEALVA